MRPEHYDFKGYATRYDLLCDDGRIIKKGAFSDQDGTEVNIVWNHIHNDPAMVLGHAYLESADDGMISYGVFNNTERGKLAKQLYESKDILGLSIYANKLKQVGDDVVHGVIRELSLVLAPANPGALVDYSIAHGADSEDELYAFLVGDEYTQLTHGTDNTEKETTMAEVTNNENTNEVGEETIGDIYDSMSDKQKDAVAAIVAAVVSDQEGEEYDDDDYDDDDDYYDDYDEGGPMKHNAFYGDEMDEGVMMHSAINDIITLAQDKTVGTLKSAINIYANDNNLSHDAISSGFVQDPLASGNISYMFPEFKDLRPGAPELITNDQGWISSVINGVTKVPMTRVRVSHVDIRNIDDLRARGYKKGKEKPLVGNYSVVRRTVDPQTVEIRSQLFRDDVTDLRENGIDYVQFQYKIDHMQLNEELAMAIMLGDFREDGTDGKIEEAHIKPIWTDDELFTIHRDIDPSAITPQLQGSDTSLHFGDSFIAAESLIQELLYAREDIRVSGTQDMYITPHMLNKMLLSRDSNGRRIYSSKAELAAALNVGTIHTVEQFNNRVRTDGNGNKHQLIAIVGDMKNYTVGSAKGGEITHFTDFDLNFNALISLLETRISGMITRIKSFIVLEAPVGA